MANEITTQDVYQHAYSYAQKVIESGYPTTTPEEQAYYSENVRHVERLEEAYAKGYFAGVDSKQSQPA